MVCSVTPLAAASSRWDIGERRRWARTAWLAWFRSQAGQVGVPVPFDRRAAEDSSRPTGQWAGSGEAGSSVSLGTSVAGPRCHLHLLFRRTQPMILSMLSNRRSTVLRAVLVGVALVVWLGIGSAGGMAQGKLSQVQTNDASAFLPSSAESTQAAEESKGFVDTETLPALVVLQPADGSDVTPEQLAAVEDWAQARPRPGRCHRATTGRGPSTSSVRPPSCRPRTARRCSSRTRSTVRRQTTCWPATKA